MKFTTEHAERWHLTILRDEGDDWPAVELRYWKSNSKMHPDKISVTLSRGAPHATGGVSGRMINKDGKPGKQEGSEKTYSSSLAERFPWAGEIVRGVREAAGLTPEATGCGW